MRIKGDVSWYIPNRKKPIAYSTKATSDIISFLSKDGCTISELINKINYNVEAKEILGLYISKGYGNIIAREWFR